MIKFYLNRKTTLFTYHLLFQESKQLLLTNKELLDSLAHQLLLEN
ncbi:MAG: hypothetical protein U9532_01850 ['Conium maculatum' witches'-broom phytoplasma]|nr:hypothetical protein ['Conium maculatum' witches'-broom phytoplasma]